jgi:peptidoglycan L-alanyl-D-glutamate endopeptidase CwlK
MNIDEVIRAIQKKVGVGVDGKAGPKTWAAIHARLLPNAPRNVPDASLTQRADERSEKAIATLLAEVQPYARALVFKATAVGITIKILSGLRTYAEQDALYAQGRSKPGPIVTNGRGGFSNHNFGIAFDIGVFEGPKYLGETPKYNAVGALGTDLGLEWGGNWKTIKDAPHFQLRPHWATDISEREMLAALREKKVAGESVFV